MSASLPMPGEVLVQRYELREICGSGGFGVVYRAWDRELRAEIALKVLRPERADQASLERLRREAALTRSISSPNLVRVFDLARDGDRTFLTMDWIGGETWRSRMARGQLSIAECHRVGLGVLRGLAQLHAAGVVHRDVKPANVLLRLPGSGPDDVVLGDLGMALRLNPEVTRVTHDRSLLGTLAYLAPEQLRGGVATPATDLYALALALFEALTGRLPGIGNEEMAPVLERLHLAQKALDPRGHRREVPEWMASWIALSLATEPAHRYRSTQAALADFEARRAPAASRARRRRRRNVRLAAATLAVAVSTTAAWFLVHQPRFAYIRRSSPDGPGIEAIGRRGEVLWQLADIDGRLAERTALVRLAQGARPILAVIREYPGAQPTLDSAFTLHLLDPTSGEHLRAISLVRPTRVSPVFDNLPPTFFLDSITPLDLDEDGIDEILVNYRHAPGWPGYAVLYEPKADRSRIVLAAGGHQEFLRRLDLDDDDRDELLFVGTSSVLGRYSTVSVVRVQPWINEALGTDPSNGYATTPELSRGNTDEDFDGSLAWAAILDAPDNLPLVREPPLVDRKARRIFLTYANQTTRQISFDGLSIPNPPSQLSDVERFDHRRNAFRAFREGRRLERVGDHRLAAEIVARGTAEAQLAGESALAEALARREASSWLRAGETARGSALFESLWSGSRRASDIAFDAAEAFEALTRPVAAVGWYQRGLRKGAADSSKSKVFFLYGIVRNLVALRDFEGALLATERFGEAFALHRDDYRIATPSAWIRMRRGDPPESWPAIPPIPNVADEYSASYAQEVERRRSELVANE